MDTTAQLWIERDKKRGRAGHAPQRDQNVGLADGIGGGLGRLRLEGPDPAAERARDDSRWPRSTVFSTTDPMSWRLHDAGGTRCLVFGEGIAVERRRPGVMEAARRRERGGLGGLGRGARGGPGAGSPRPDRRNLGLRVAAGGKHRVAYARQSCHDRAETKRYVISVRHARQFPARADSGEARAQAPGSGAGRLEGPAPEPEDGEGVPSLGTALHPFPWQAASTGEST